MTEITKKKHSRLIPVTEWSKFHSWPTLGGLRHLIFHRKTNGFDRVTRKLGRRVLINEDDFFTWVEFNQKVINDD